MASKAHPRWFLFSLLLLCGFHTSAQSPLAGLPFVRNFHTVEYKAGIQNWDIAQDKRGILYIANNFGLLEYDGDRWELYRVLNGTKVRSVAIDARGRIYVGCQRDFGYFFPDARGRLMYTSLADSLPAEHRDFDETWSVYIDNDKVYFCTFQKIFSYDGLQFTIAEAPAGIELSFLVNRQLFATSHNTGITRMDGSTLRPFKGGELFRNIGVSGIIPLHADEFLVSTFQHGIHVLNNGTTRAWSESNQSYFRESHVNCMVRLQNGNVAVGTQNNGLLILSPDGRLLMKLTTGKGLSNRTVLSIYEDDLNNLWLGQNNGIAYVELGSPFTFINEESGLPGTGYAAYLDANRLYAGTNTGLYVKDDTRGFSLVENTRGQVYHIGNYDGDILTGHHNGALRVDGATAQQISPEQGTWTFLPLKDQEGLMIGGSYTGLHLFEKINGHWQYRNRVRGFDESSRIMAEAPDGKIWMTHGYKGAFRLTLNAAMDSVNNIEFYGYNKGFFSNNLISVFRIRNELLFTSERGVYKYDPISDSFKRDELFTKIFGPDVELWSVQEDALGNIYFIGSTHIGVLKRNAVGDYTIETNPFNKIRKFLNDDLVNITILKNNEVLFGGKDGFIHYDPTMVLNRKAEFSTIIRKVATTRAADSVLFFGNYIRNDSISAEQMDFYKPELSYQSNSLTFTFAATSFEGNGQLTFQHFLENYEKDWSDWTTNTQKEYTNLKEGHYKFHVRARNVNGQISKEAVYDFYIHPPWYRSMWAYLFYVLSVITLLLTAFKLLDRKYKRKQRLMALRQKKELYKKENELNMLSQQTQEEISRLQHEKLQSELRHMNSELGTSTMHLLNKNEFITGIKANLQHIIRKSTHDEVKRELLQITKDIENNISADADWEQFQFHFDRVHGDFSTRFKAAFPALSPQEIKLSAYLRMNLSSKEIAQLLNISIRGVEISRYRLRKKLQLERNTNLQDFILNF
ncbi:MAG TPA: triple tyrosine motif-containing protein [Chryseosolibacter sp.]|nr:triple tyrosine motif-containing protein [Chryseosolibacter sp.]